MTQGLLTQKHIPLFDRIRWLVSNLPWQRLALAAVLVLSAFLNLFRLTSEGYGNTYYSAAVKEGAVRFFLIGDRGHTGQQGGSTGGWGGSSQNEAVGWVQDNCQQVPQELWQSSSTSNQGGGGPGRMGAQALYECSSRGS